MPMLRALIMLVIIMLCQNAQAFDSGSSAVRESHLLNVALVTAVAGHIHTTTSFYTQTWMPSFFSDTDTESQNLTCATSVLDLACDIYGSRMKECPSRSNSPDQANTEVDAATGQEKPTQSHIHSQIITLDCHQDSDNPDDESQPLICHTCKENPARSGQTQCDSCLRKSQDVPQSAELPYCAYCDEQREGRNYFGRWACHYCIPSTEGGNNAEDCQICWDTKHSPLCHSDCEHSIPIHESCTPANGCVNCPGCRIEIVVVRQDQSRVKTCSENKETKTLKEYLNSLGDESEAYNQYVELLSYRINQRLGTDINIALVSLFLFSHGHLCLEYVEDQAVEAFRNVRTLSYQPVQMPPPPPPPTPPVIISMPPQDVFAAPPANRNNNRPGQRQRRRGRHCIIL